MAVWEWFLVGSGVWVVVIGYITLWFWGAGHKRSHRGP